MGANIKNRNRSEKLDIVLLFHYNQNFVPFSQLAAKICYEKLTKVLLDSYFDQKFCIHISSSLLSSLLWCAPETIYDIKNGIKDNKFEIFSSTFSQNIILSTNNEQNDLQIKENHKFIQKIFNISSKGFWNPERCWSEDVFKLIVSNKFKYSFIEQHILKDSNISVLNKPLKIKDKLILFPENEDFHSCFNYAIWSGNFEPVLEFIDKTSKNSILCYTEDIEASALWAYEKGYSYLNTINNLKNLLVVLKDKVNIINCEQLLKKIKPVSITEIPKKGCANWMNYAIKYSNKPYHEKGFNNWFDFSENSFKLIKYRKIFSLVYKHLKEVEQIIDSKILENIFNIGKLCFISHQFEFGCIGIGEVNSYFWESAKLAHFYFYLCKWMKENKFPERFNIYNNETEVFILKNEFIAAFISVKNGQLLHLINLKKGEEIVGESFGQNMLNENIAFDNISKDQKIMIPENIVFDKKIETKNKFHFSNLLPEYLTETKEKYNVNKIKKIIFKEYIWESCGNGLEIIPEPSTISSEHSYNSLKIISSNCIIFYRLVKNSIDIKLEFSILPKVIKNFIVPNSLLMIENGADIFSWIEREEKKEIGIKNNLNHSFLKIKFSGNVELIKTRSWMGFGIHFIPKDKELTLKWKVI